jgi:hypothetical protein
MKIENQIEPLSPEWFKARIGKLTSSTIENLIIEPKEKSKKDAGELSSTTKDFLFAKIAERLTGVRRDFSNAATEYGTKLEKEAIEFFEFHSGKKVLPCGFIEAIPGFYGGTPDGIIESDNGIIQIKCPFEFKNHLSFFFTKDIETFKQKNRGYFWQCMSDMNVTGASYCDFVSYCPDMPPNMKVFHLRIDRNEEDIKFLNKKIQDSIDYMNTIIRILNGEQDHEPN